MIPAVNVNNCIVAPSILSADFSRLGDEVRDVAAAGADWIHFDVMDGRFVPNISVGLPVLKSLRRGTDLPIDVHLMIVEPDLLIPEFAAAGADLISVQVEACTHLHRTLQNIRGRGCRAGVALNPHTPIDFVRYVRDLLDFVLVMTVNPGFGGQSYIAACTSKIARLRAEYPDLPIEVDGGINDVTAAVASAAGAGIFVAGSAVFSKPDYRIAVDGIRHGALAARRSRNP